MSSYIDADAFIDDLYEHEFSNWCDKDEVSTLVNDAPSIDIVRCAECKYYKQSEAFCENGNGLWQAGDECFCSYGQKGDENVETD